MERATIKIKGMSGDHAVAGVRSALAAINGVTDVDVSIGRAQATGRYDPQMVRPSQFRTALRVMGFEAGMITLREEARPAE